MLSDHIWGVLDGITCLFIRSSLLQDMHCKYFYNDAQYSATRNLFNSLPEFERNVRMSEPLRSRGSEQERKSLP
jgi:hypothetical protein